jgi:hypothetical protein
MLEYWLLKKSMTGDGEDDTTALSALEKDRLERHVQQ